MSRIGREPIKVPAGVTITVDGNKITVKGPKGTLTNSFNPHLTYQQEGDEFKVLRPNDSKELKMNHGTTRAIINNMVHGVSEGYSKTLTVKGVGYRVEMRGEDLVLHVGHSHEDVVPAVNGIKMSINTKTMDIIVEGIDKQLVGQVAANIRELKKPECYHGKGIRYKDEVVTLRAAASAKK